MQFGRPVGWSVNFKDAFLPTSRTTVKFGMDIHGPTRMISAAWLYSSATIRQWNISGNLMDKPSHFANLKLGLKTNGWISMKWIEDYNTIYWAYSCSHRDTPTWFKTLWPYYITLHFKLAISRHIQETKLQKMFYKCSFYPTLLYYGVQWIPKCC